MSRQRVISESSRASTTTPTGQVIIAREHNALAPHPARGQNGRLVPTRGVNRLLVDPGDAGTGAERASGVELYECDPCGWTADNAISVRAHLSSHNAAKTATDYDVKTMRALVSIVEKYRKARVRNFAERAADELNTLGFKTRDGERWLAANVSSRYRDWRDRPEVKRSRAVKAALSDISEEKVTPTPKHGRVSPTSPQASPTSPISSPPDHPVAARLARLASEVLLATSEIADLAREVASLPLVSDVLTPAELDALRAKAARYDQIAGALGSLNDGGR